MTIERQAEFPFIVRKRPRDKTFPTPKRVLTVEEDALRTAKPTGAWWLSDRCLEIMAKERGDDEGDGKTM